MAVATVAEYIESLDENGKKYVNEFIEFMGKTYPNLTHKISFSMPMWLVGKKMNEGYVAISAAKKHFSIHFSEEAFVLELKELLPACKYGKQCINIGYGDEESFQVVKEKVADFLEKIKK